MSEPPARDRRPTEVPADARRDYLKELGVPPIVNGAGTYTRFCGSLMLPEVVQAIETISRSYVRLEELHDAVGARLASLLGCEAAMVTSGASGALTLGTAACLTGGDPSRIARLPDTAGMKREVIVQRTHRFPYDRAVRNCGARLIEVESSAELDRAINDRTALLLFLNKAAPCGRISAGEFIRIGRTRRVPTLNDAAADVPPAETLSALTAMGFDLVAFSGGKGLQGPQSTGMLLGRADLIHAARMHTGPHSEAFGRGLKVSKEEMVGLMVAVERYLERDHEAEWQEWEARVRAIREGLAGIAAVRTERFVPAVANQVPHVRIRWNREMVKADQDEVMNELRAGEPSIELVPVPSEPDSVEVAAWTLRPGEAEVVARRVRDILTPRG